MKKIYQGTGKKKAAIAQVRLSSRKHDEAIFKVKTPSLRESIALKTYFKNDTLLKIALKPLHVTNVIDQFDIDVRFHGGGVAGQAAALCHGLAKTLAKISKNYHNLLRSNALLTRDARVKERKKYGLKKARKAPQFSKR